VNAGSCLQAAFFPPNPVEGIDLQKGRFDDNEWMEVIATGTAVRHIRGTHNIPPTGQGRVVIPTN